MFPKEVFTFRPELVLELSSIHRRLAHLCTSAFWAVLRLLIPLTDASLQLMKACTQSACRHPTRLPYTPFWNRTLRHHIKRSLAHSTPDRHQRQSSELCPLQKHPRQVGPDWLKANDMDVTQNRKGCWFLRIRQGAPQPELTPDLKRTQPRIPLQKKRVASKAQGSALFTWESKKACFGLDPSLQTVFCWFRSLH